MDGFDFLREEKTCPECGNLRKDRKTVQPEGHIWLSLLIRYNLDGTSSVIRSFAKPAAESKIKGLTKPKKKEESKLNIKTPSKEKKSIF